MSETKPPPLHPERPPREPCPVCGEISYSREGVHPQCAQERAEPARLERVKRSFAPDPPGGTGGGRLGRWQKRCGKCGKTVHSRRNACDCGHAFRRGKA